MTLRCQASITDVDRPQLELEQGSVNASIQIHFNHAVTSFDNWSPELSVVLIVLGSEWTNGDTRIGVINMKGSSLGHEILCKPKVERVTVGSRHMVAPHETAIVELFPFAVAFLMHINIHLVGIGKSWHQSFLPTFVIFLGQFGAVRRWNTLLAQGCQRLQFVLATSSSSIFRCGRCQ